MTTLSKRLNAARSAMREVNTRGRKVDQAVAVCQKLLDPPLNYPAAQQHIDRMKLVSLCLDVGIRAGEPRSTMIALAVRSTGSSPVVALYQGVRAFARRAA